MSSLLPPILTTPETRHLLRYIQGYLCQSHLNKGAIRESLGLVDVYYHPSETNADWNYVTPRRNTAWVAAVHIQAGVEWLRALRRSPRTMYIRELLMPSFGETLEKIGLYPEQERAIWLHEDKGSPVSLEPYLLSFTCVINQVSYQVVIGTDPSLKTAGFRMVGTLVDYVEKTTHEKTHAKSSLEQLPRSGK